ncbi:hypothetical protein [Caballeronia calidae]
MNPNGGAIALGHPLGDLRPTQRVGRDSGRWISYRPFAIDYVNLLA